MKRPREWTWSQTLDLLSSIQVASKKTSQEASFLASQLHNQKIWSFFEKFLNQLCRSLFMS